MGQEVGFVGELVVLTVAGGGPRAALWPLISVQQPERGHRSMRTQPGYLTSTRPQLLPPGGRPLLPPQAGLAGQGGA